MKDIVQMNDPVLRTQAAYVEPSEISSEKIQTLITNMHQSLATQNDGVAIAAPQIGESYQIFTVAPFIFDQPENEHFEKNKINARRMSLVSMESGRCRTSTRGDRSCIR